VKNTALTPNQDKISVSLDILNATGLDDRILNEQELVSTNLLANLPIHVSNHYIPRDWFHINHWGSITQLNGKKPLPHSNMILYKVEGGYPFTALVYYNEDPLILYRVEITDLDNSVK
jgi:hypothetical protein